MGKRLGIISLLALILTFGNPLLTAGPQSSSRPSVINKPKLIIMLVIDQFRYDYLVRFRPEFAKGGFNLLLQGANFVDCRYDYAITATCPGHATLATGAYANLNGIIGNTWWVPSEHRETYCAADSSVQPVGAAPGQGMSPKNLTASTFGDELRLVTGFQSRVVTVSWKDRAAIMLGGHLANGAYWADPDTAHFITSTYYMPTLPKWVSDFNAQSPAKAYCGKPWRALEETPGVGGQVLHRPPAETGQPCPSPKFTAWLPDSPYANQMELDFALAAIENERLGHGPDPDLLAVSLSANDYIGHAYGPYSPEVADVTLQTDRYLAEFFSKVDQLVGLDNVWITLSADHGVAPSPQFILDHHLGRGHFNPQVLKGVVQQALSDAFGQGDWVVNVDEFYVDLNHDVLASHHIDPDRAEAVAARAIDAVPGVRIAFTRGQFLNGQLPPTPLARKFSNSFNPAHSGDIFFIPEPYAVETQSETGSTHGTPWNYDAQVPLVFWGNAFKPGTYTLPAQPIDLASTLAAALGISQPSDAQGSPLSIALK